MDLFAKFMEKCKNKTFEDTYANYVKSDNVKPQGSIGNGLWSISKFLSSNRHEDSESSKQLLDYLLALNYRGQVRNIQMKIKTKYEK